MYPISNEVFNLFIKNYRQVVDIAFYGLSDELHITEADIVAGGLAVTRSCVTGTKIQIGSVVASSLSINLDNRDGRFNDVSFEGAEMYVRIGVKKWDARHWENAVVHYIPFGYYTIDEAPRKLETITLTALDRMVTFDKSVNLDFFVFPMTVAQLVSRCCEVCNITLNTDLSTLPNYSYVVTEAPTSSNMTYRQILSWCCEIMGVCAFMDWNGKLVLKWYTATNMKLKASERFSSDIFEESVTVTGIAIGTGEDVVMIGEDAYLLEILQNPLIQHDAITVAQTLANALTGFTYTPFKATTLPCPQYYPLDIITFVDKQGNEIQSVITDYTFGLNNGTTLEGKGLTNTRNGYAALNPFTRRENAVIRKTEEETQKILNKQISSVLALNELICNSLGVYRTPVTQADGSVIYYLHDQQQLEDSLNIWTMTANGIAWTTNGWNDGSPVWSYGVTSAGDALFRMLSAEGINVAKAGSDYHIEISPSAFQIYYRDMLVTSIVADEMKIPKAQISSFLEIGAIRIVPYSTTGTNIIFVSS